ncbi:MAG: hypothetical protein ABIG71_03925 [Candidatus Uhrbacteria bacterium]
MQTAPWISRAIKSAGDQVIIYETLTQRVEALQGIALEVIRSGRSLLLCVPHRVWLPNITTALEEVGVPVVSLDRTAGVHAAWAAALAARAPGVCIIGTRTVSFTIPEHLGAIIIDEAHSDDCKQWDMDPKYDARAVTAKTSAARGIPRFLLSPAPRAEEWARAQHHIHLRSGQPQRVEVVNLEHYWRGGGNGYLTPQMLELVSATLVANRTVCVLHNRLGRMGRIRCRDCNHIPTCAACQHPFTEYGDGLRCTKCGGVSPPMSVCPACNSPYLRTSGIGTAGIAELILKHYPTARIALVDSDNPKSPSSQVNIIIGSDRLFTTIAPQLTSSTIGAIIVLCAERLVSGDDYRANERTLQALAEVAVWARSWEVPLLVQTQDVDQPSLLAVARGDIQIFYRRELDERRALGYPPSVRFLRIDSEERVSEAIFGDISTSLRGLGSAVVGVEGPFRYGAVRRRERTSILVKITPDASEELLGRIASCVPSAWTIDLDPVDLRA